MPDPEVERRTAERVSYAPAYVQRRVLNTPAPLRAAEHASFDAIVLFADISGFTPLASRLAAEGAVGAEDLSRLLNDYFGELLALVASHGGEPFKFAGDALMALWPAPDGDIAIAAQRAAACGLVIQSGRHSRGAGRAALPTRVAVARGIVTAVQLRSGDCWHFVVGGPPLDDVARAQAHADPGDVVVSPIAWDALAGHADGAPLDEGCRRLVRVDAAPLDPPRPMHWTVQSLLRLDGYVPDPVRARLAAGHGEWLAELRQVTVLFAEVADLDHAAADWPVRLQAVVNRTQPIVQRYEGFLKEIVIDDKGVVLIVIFGLPPAAHENDPARGARAALELAKALRAAGHGAAIGVTTGRCFCGVAGSDVRREYAVIGDAMNVAARLMQAAAGMPAGQRILCDVVTRHRAAARLEFEDLPPLTVKGKDQPLAVARPLGLRDHFARAATEIVGRERERAAIAEALQRIVQGSGAGTLLITGEAGMGKSRLVSELSRLAREQGVLVLHGAADAIESATPYFAWREVFAQLLGVAALDDRAARRAEVERRLDPELANQAPLLEAVLTLGIPDTPETAELTGQMRANATRDLLLTMLERAASTELTCVVLEDAHWLDAASWSLALGVSRRIVSLQLTLTSRPIADPQPRELALLQSGPQCTTLVLDPLAAGDTLALVCRRLGASTLQPEIETLIRTRAGGHPFFAEELASALRDTGVIKVVHGVCRLAKGVDPAALAFPDTLQGLVTARIDLLAPQEQLALKVASVIGTAFAVRVLRDVHPVREDLGRLESSVEELRRADLTVLEMPAPDLAYAFKHVITREVAYNLMLFMQRRQLHHAIAEWHERVHGDDRPELFPVLAHHWSHAGVVEKAVAYQVRSATRTFSMGLSRAAVDQGLDAARMLGLTLPRDPAEIGLLLKAELESIHERLGGREPGALLDLPPLTDASIGALIGLLLRIEPFVHVSGQMELFAFIATRCMSLTLEHGNGPAAPLVYAMFSIVYRLMTQDTPTAVAFSELSLDLDAKQGGRLFSPVAFINHWFIYHWVRPVEERLDVVAQAADTGFATNDVMYGCFNNSAYVIYVALAGRPLPEVIEVARRHYARNGRRVLNAAFHCIHELQVAKALAGQTLHQLSLTDAEYDEERDIASVCGTDQYTEAGWYYASKMRLHYLFGDAPGALRYAGETVPLLPSFMGQPIESEFAVYRTLALLARARELGPDASGEREAMMRDARSGVEQIRLWASVGKRSFAHRLLLVEGELASVEGRAEDADRAFVAAAQAARSLGHTHYEGLAHERRAALRHAAGDDAARESVDAARDAYSRWGARALVEALDRRYA